MITFIANLQVPPANAGAFEELMHYVAAKSNQESGVVHYGFARSVEQPEEYVVVEVYADQAACAAHGETEWVRESIPKYLRLIDGVPRITQYVSPGADPIPMA